jgi:hypothetical protein
LIFEETQLICVERYEIVYLTDHKDSLRELKLVDKIDTLSFWQQPEVLKTLEAFLQPQLREHGIREEEDVKVPIDTPAQSPATSKSSNRFSFFGKRSQSTQPAPVPVQPKLPTDGTKWSVKLEEVSYRWETDLDLLESTSRDIIVFRVWKE